MKYPITVGLPVVKNRFFYDSLKSVLNQTYKDFEVIIINNAIKETEKKGIKQIVQTFGDPRIRYYENTFQIPIIDNWNKCLKLATGEYFVLFTDDDLYEIDFLQEMFELCKKHPYVKLGHCRVRIIDEYERTIAISPTCPEYENAINFVWHRINHYRLQYVPDFICSTISLKAQGGFVSFPLGWASDDATWLSMAFPNGVAATPKILCNWRQSSINISTVGKVTDKLRAIEEYSRWLNIYLKSFYSKDVDKEDRILLKDIENKVPAYLEKLKLSALQSREKSLSESVRFLASVPYLRTKFGILPKKTILAFLKYLDS